VVSADSDFSAILAAQEAERPSFILFRETNLLVARDYIDMLLPALPMLEPELLAGCVAVFRNSRLRTRRLPFSAWVRLRCQPLSVTIDSDADYDGTPTPRAD
jgi:hypothetical protein